MDSILIEQAINDPSDGKPISPFVKSEIEARFNVDLSDVKIYTGVQSQMVLKSISADSYAKGDAVFVHSEFDYSGIKRALAEKLSAHETVHISTMGLAKPKAVSTSEESGLNLEQLMTKK